MGQIQRSFAALSCAAVFAFGFAACGGDDTSSASSSKTQSATKSESSASESDGDSTETTKADVSGIGKDKDFCAGLVKAEKDLNNANFDTSSLKDLLPVMKDLTGKAPSELKGDLKLLTDAFTKAAPVIDKLTQLQADAAKDPAKAQEILAEMEKLGKEADVFSSKEFEQAAARLSAYAEEKCGIKTE